MLDGDNQGAGLVAIFRGALKRDREEAGPEEPPIHLEAALMESYARGRDAWPTLAVSPDAYARHLAECCSDDDWATGLAKAVGGRHAEDLYLASACASGNAHAMELLAVRFASTVERAVERVDRSQAFVNEARQALFQRLIQPVDEGGARIARYSGSGPLDGWLAVSARRLALNMKDEDAARERAHRRARPDDLPPEAGIEIDFLRAKYGHEFEAAVDEVFQQLSDRDRMLLRLKVVTKMTYAQIGKAQQVDASTAQRWVMAIVARVTESIRALLAARMRLTASDVDSLGNLMASQLDVSIARLLAQGGEDK